MTLNRNNKDRSNNKPKILAIDYYFILSFFKNKLPSFDVKRTGTIQEAFRFMEEEKFFKILVLCSITYKELSDFDIERDLLFIFRLTSFYRCHELQQKTQSSKTKTGGLVCQMVNL